MMEKVNKKRRILIIKIALTIAYIALVFGLYFLNVSCLFKQITGIPCLSCGMTRAIISAMKINFIQAFKYHFMFWSVPILYMYIIKDGKLFKNKAVNLTCIILIGVGFIINWILKIV